MMDNAPVAVERISTGRFRIAVPDSPVLRDAERLGNGNVNFMVVVDSGPSYALEMVPAPLTPAAAPGNTAAAAVLRSRLVAVPGFTAWHPVDAQGARSVAHTMRMASVSPSSIPSCYWVKDGSPRELWTRLGEVHVANAKGMEETFDYHTQADSTISVGFSANGKNWSASGTDTVNNELGTDGGFTEGKKTAVWAAGHVYYQAWKNSQASPACPNGKDRYVEATHSASDAFPGNNLPPSQAASPYHGCLHDPYGFATVPKSTGYWDSDMSRAITISGAATIFGFNFSASTGFTKDIKDSYSNHSSINTYVCGTQEMPSVPNVFNATF